MVTIIITTYDRGDGSRTKLCVKTIGGLREHLSYPDLRWIIADDGSNQETHLGPIAQALEGTEFEFSVVPRKGVGISKNTALQKAWEYSDVVLLLEDDWYLKYDIPMERFVALLRDNKELGMIRLGFLGGTSMEAKLRDFGFPNTFWELRQGSDVYIYSGQVSIRHKRFYDVCGYHPEGVSPGDEELDFCKHYNGVENAPKILWPCEYGSTINAGPFINIGLNSSLNGIKPE